MQVLALNYGSSSLKFLVAKIDHGKMNSSQTGHQARGSIDQIGEGETTLLLDLFWRLTPRGPFATFLFCQKGPLIFLFPNGMQGGNQGGPEGLDEV